MDELSNRAPAGFELIHEDRELVRVALSGELDFATVPVIERALAPLLAAGPQRLVLDVRQVSFADSSAIALWVRAAAQVRRIELRGASPLLVRVLERMGLSERLGVREAGAAALNAGPERDLERGRLSDAGPDRPAGEKPGPAGAQKPGRPAGEKPGPAGAQKPDRPASEKRGPAGAEE